MPGGVPGEDWEVEEGDAGLGATEGVVMGSATGVVVVVVVVVLVVAEVVVGRVVVVLGGDRTIDRVECIRQLR